MNSLTSSHSRFSITTTENKLPDIKLIGQLKLGDKVAFNSREWELTDFCESNVNGEVQIVFTPLSELKGKE